MSNVVIMGGFTESRRLLEPVAEEAIDWGFGDDAEIMTLREADRAHDEDLRRLMAGKTVITHSAGLTTLPDARSRISDNELPSELIIVAGPEPRTTLQLVVSAARKTFNHFYQRTDHSRAEHLRIVADNAAELLLHSRANLSLIPEISHFSTSRQLRAREIDASDRVGYFMMAGDEFYKPSGWRGDPTLRGLSAKGAIVDELPGGHDELLIAPESVLRGVRQAFARAETHRQPEV